MPHTTPPTPKGKLPSSVRSADGERKATLTRLRGEIGYYVSFYSLDRVGAPTYSSASPRSPLTKARAYQAAYGWIS